MSLTQIPREIRLKILKHAIDSPTWPPKCPAASQEHRERLTKSIYSSEGGQGIWRLPPRNTAASLLLANKQIHEETQYVLNHLDGDYYLDIMFVKSYGLWPTWTMPSLPKTQYLGSVLATFRLFEPTADLHDRFQGSLSFHHGCGGPPLGVWSFYKLITALIEYGPGYLNANLADEGPNYRNVNPQFVAKDMFINILPPTDEAPHSNIFWEENAEREDRVMNDHDQITNPPRTSPEKRLAKYLADNFGELTKLDYYTLDYGAPLFESISGKVVFFADDEEYECFDMSALWQEHEVHYWGSTPEYIEQRKRDHAAWKAWVDQRRKRMEKGLELNNVRPVTTIIG